jgi:hypothetical protein
MDFIDKKLWKNCGILSGIKDLFCASIIIIKFNISLIFYGELNRVYSYTDSSVADSAITSSSIIGSGAATLLRVNLIGIVMLMSV